MRNTPPFRADHVGSLLRPAGLLAAREDFAAGRLDADELRAVEDTAIEGAVAMQREAGLQTATDGEFRRASWHMDFIYQLGGISKAPGNLAVKFRNADREASNSRPRLCMSAARSGWTTRSSSDDFSYLQSVVDVGNAEADHPVAEHGALPRRPGRASTRRSTPTSRSSGATWPPPTPTRWQRLAELGCTYLQLDDTSLAYLNDPAQRAEIAGRGEDADHLHLRYIRQVNSAIAGRPDSLRVTTHMCRGNFRSSWAAEGGYDFVAEALFSELAVDGFFLEYDDERSGGFEPLRFVPAGKMVVLGLVTTKSGALEDPDVLKRRIDEAARYVPLGQLCLSPQCGFSSTVEGNALTQEEQLAKLRLIADVARDVWGDS